MRSYIHRLRQKPDHHKKRFALLTSASVTMAILALWTMVNFGAGGVLSQNNSEREVAKQNEVSPLQSIQMNMASSFSAISDSFRDLGNGFRSNIYGE